MTRMAVVLVVAAASCGVLATPQQERLDELIRDVPAGETVRIALSVRRPLWDMPTVLSNSDAVVEGRVTNLHSEVTGLPDHVSTTLVIVVKEMWLDRRAAPAIPRAASDRVLVRQPGGRLEYRGRFIEVQDHKFPTLSVGTEVVLFLSQVDGSDLMEIVDGPYGAFVEEGQRVKSLLPTWHELRGRYEGLDRGSFKSMVAKVIADAR